jgi:hypothetical protein
MITEEEQKVKEESKYARTSRKTHLQAKRHSAIVGAWQKPDLCPLPAARFSQQAAWEIALCEQSRF